MRWDAALGMWRSTLTGGRSWGAAASWSPGLAVAFQAVDTAAPYRRRGICSRLVVEAVQRSAERYGAERFVIAADPEYHALGLYESLGFARTERVCGACRRPG